MTNEARQMLIVFALIAFVILLGLIAMIRM
jgi:hypothetical protein